ncbi:hypothetical protein DNK57_01935 [Methanothermobacter thermautotrophicus]|jgi:hypothetical protein|uniref:DUF5668 domain-containing protein n=1 Tax=Methanothermobacter thermautotrophicus TaxID=145262 RepID=A0A842YMG2_METTF|nr:hypothetical protein [Methanothermobacter thermautotrophicus]MBE2899591.1 hypothetical protein [Methanothermobacter thermautotrophicus]MCQ8904733.1 hypothetical protein [Methanothermobacter sp.]
MGDEVEINRRPRQPPEGGGQWRIYLGVILVIIGVLWFAFDAGIIPPQYSRFWPQALLVILGILIIIKSRS